MKGSSGPAIQPTSSIRPINIPSCTGSLQLLTFVQTHHASCKMSAQRRLGTI